MAVVGVEIEQRAVVLDGHTFGAAGAYEKLAGVVRFAVDRANPANHAITGLVRCEWRPTPRVPTLPLADRYHIPHPTIDLQDPGARLTVRERREAAAVEVERGAWRFSDASSLTVENGFEPGKIYELVYRAANPPLVGLGFLAVRDTAAWLRCASAADGNPCAETLDRAYAFGVSQSGRFLRHLLHLGLNEDEAGPPVFHPAGPHLPGGRRGEFNHRFGQPSLNATHAVGSLFPFTDTVETDPLTGERGALLARLEARGTLPKIFTINTSAEYWRGAT